MSFDELKQEVELLDREAMRAIRAGSHYYDAMSGLYLGFRGTDQDVRFIGAEDFTPYTGDDAGYLFSSSSVSSSAKGEVLRQFLPSGMQSLNFVGVNSCETCAIGYGNYAGNFYFDHYNSVFDNMSNLQNLMCHESYHWNYDFGQNANGYDGFPDEYNAVMAQVNDPSYQYATSLLKGYVVNLLQSLGYSLDDAKRLAGVS